jgi:hypothetical protein
MKLAFNGLLFAFIVNLLFCEFTFAKQRHSPHKKQSQKRQTHNPHKKQVSKNKYMVPALKFSQLMQKFVKKVEKPQFLLVKK